MRRDLFGRFVRDAKAVAAVEFALIVPLLVTLYFGTVEAASLYAVDRRVATVASTMADLVSREQDCIDTDKLNSYFAAATGIMQPYVTTNLKQVVSFLAVSSTGTVTIKWSKPYGTGAVARNTGVTTAIGTATNINTLARTKGFLVAAEIQYPYTPLFGVVIKNINLAHTEYFLPRYEEEITTGTSCP
ncbi:MAG: pilus assembly protein [Alphaproteobacteria bacterium]|nr:MAG: pilus assembly protein [Alphaproteobacteria bacterium]